jgi:hypothetical protein
MKILPILTLMLSITAHVTAGEPVLSAVPIVLGPTSTREGDSIFIREVLSASPLLKSGDKVVVRGTYHLQSAAVATLVFCPTKRFGRETTSASQKLEVKSGSGDFELSCVVRSPADFLGLSLLFYPPGELRGNFGEVKFGTAEQMRRGSNKKPNQSLQPTAPSGRG